MDMFPFKLESTGLSALAVVLITILSIAVNAALWFGFAFLVAYAAAKGWGAA